MILRRLGAGGCDLHRVIDRGLIGVRAAPCCAHAPSGHRGAKVVVMRGRVRKALRMVVQLAVIPVWVMRV